MPNRRITSPAVTKRIASAVQATERRVAYRGDASRPRFFARPGMILTGIVTTTITARSGNMPGFGAVTLLTGDGSGSDEPPSTDPDDTLSVLNDNAHAFPSDPGKRAKIHWERGSWRILTREC